MQSLKVIFASVTRSAGVDSKLSKCLFRSLLTDISNNEKASTLKIRPAVTPLRSLAANA